LFSIFASVVYKNSQSQVLLLEIKSTILDYNRKRYLTHRLLLHRRIARLSLSNDAF
jgi:hypothetical protein